MKKIITQINFFKLVLVLVKRDYAMQYAGTLLGLLWLLIQYVFQIAVYYVLFGIVFSDGGGRFIYQGDYFLYIMSGMMLWIPVSEMLLRSCSIIYDNKTLVKRTGMGMKLFIWIPVVQGLIYYFLLFGISFAAGFLRGGLHVISPLAVFYGAAVILFFSGWSFIFSKASLILKDFTPVMRLILQVLFWLTPIIYAVPEEYQRYLAWNPFYGIIELNRWMFHPSYRDLTYVDFQGMFALILLSIVSFLISRIRLESVALDQI
ncbi:MAG: ABC transporter permease [Spirochaetia bacterium]|nr:ABC transporter permease [Spirochaetia bacterium]